MGCVVTMLDELSFGSSKRSVAGVLSADNAMEESVPDYYQVMQNKLPVVALYPTRAALASCVRGTGRGGHARRHPGRDQEGGGL